MKALRGNTENKQKTRYDLKLVYGMLCFMLPAGVLAEQADVSKSQILDRLQRLEVQQQELEKQLENKDSRIDELEEKLSSKQRTVDTATTSHGNTHTPGKGTTIAATDSGSLNFRFYSYVRYLNQKGLDDSYTNAFGKVSDIDQRQDFQVNKMNLFFSGWAMDPRFHYLGYVWTTNASQGRGAQVVVAGNLQYDFSYWLTGGVGIDSLPGTRSTAGNFPNWLGVDNRLISDEFFRPSYTTGVWIKGKFAETYNYKLMLGNNLSQLGVDAGQLDNGLNTWSGMLSWMPSGDYGPGFGDFENHQSMVTRFGLHYTYSKEDRQSQPGTEAIENVQLRLSDGSIIFTPDLFGIGIAITDATYQMVSFDAGVKFRGYSLAGEFFVRQLNDFKGPGTDSLTFNDLNDHGFQLQSSAMLIPKAVQLYLSGSKVFGEYGNPWDARLGVNVFPWKNKVARWNTELLYLDNSPVGALSLPYSVGANGLVFYTNLEVNY
jgi:hypothetical protein